MARNDETVQRVARSVLRKLPADGSSVSASTVRRGLSSTLRGYLDPAVAVLLAAGLIESDDVEYQGQRGVHYRRAEGGKS